MKRRSILSRSLLLLPFVFSLTIQAQTLLNYSAAVDENISTWNPFGYGYMSFGPYAVFNKVWVFYSDGENAVWRTKQLFEGGAWSEKQALYPAIEGRQFNLTFDGSFFHFIRYDEESIKYLRGKATPEGNIDFDPELTIYNDPLWKARDYEQPEVMMASIGIDYRGSVWILAQVARISGVDTLYKPILLSSTHSDGGWQSRQGFPKDMKDPFNHRRHGHGPHVIEIDQGKMLFVFRAIAPSARTEARLWTENVSVPEGEGLLGDIEPVNGINAESTRTSAMSPAPGIALVNTNTTVARRNQNGSWTVVSPTDMLIQFYNNLTLVNGVVRLWDRDGGNIRYRETNNHGTTWSMLSTKWNSEQAGLFNSTSSSKTQDIHHAVLWLTGETDEFDQPVNGSPLTLMMGIEGAFSFPDAPVPIAPTDGSTDVEIEPLIVWEPSAGADRYQVQLSDLPDFSELRSDPGFVSLTSYATDQLEYNTAYYWRVRSMSTKGAISEWSPTGTFTTTTRVPGPVVLVSPDSGSGGIVTDPLFVWRSAMDAIDYRFQIASDTSFSFPISDETSLVDTFYAAEGLSFDTIYYWRVQGKNTGNTGSWSPVWLFTTIPDLPSAVLLDNPPDSVIGIPLAAELSWHTAPGATEYRLQITEESDFDSPEIDVGSIADTVFMTEGLTYGATYHWRVRAFSPGGAGEWSAVRSFTTTPALPAAPLLAAPANDAHNIAVDTILIWQSVEGADAYYIELSTEADFQEEVIGDTSRTETYLMVRGLRENTRYYWRVRAFNLTGGGDWSATRTFVTTNPSFVDIENPGVPGRYELFQNYPNPFNPVTNIRFSVPVAGYVTIVIYSITGQMVGRLVDEYLAPGYYNVEFNASGLASGTYIYRMQAGEFVETKRLALVK